MATDNGAARRAIGAGNEAARRAIGTNNEAARRGIGKRIEAERRGSAVQDDINSLIRPERQRATLRTVEPRGAVAVQRGRGTWVPPATSGTGAGIASPLTEKTTVLAGKTVPDREYWPAGYTSSDGLFILPAAKTLNMTDANGAAVVFQLADPQGTIA